MRSRSFAVVTAFVVIGLDVALLWPRAASASAPTAVGGWRIERQTTPAGAVPTSPLTDDGTLAVRNSPAGVLAFAAVRYSAEGGTLLLSLSGQPPPAVPTIDACRVTSSWTAGADQTWDTKPTYDCGHHVVGTVSGSQLSWQLDPGFANGGTLDVALVPDPADTTPYAVSFALPTAASFQPSDGATAFAPPPPFGVPSAASATPAASAGVPLAPAVGAPAAAPPVVAASPPAAPQLAAVPAAVTREPGSRAAGAAALAAFAFILLVHSFVSGGARGHVPRSLLQINREGA